MASQNVGPAWPPPEAPWHLPGPELLPQHPSLGLEIVDDIGLPLMDPAGQRDEEKT